MLGNFYSVRKQSLWNFLFIVLIIISGCKTDSHPADKADKDRDGYDQPEAAALFQKMRTQDPATMEVPSEKMWNAVEETRQLKAVTLMAPASIQALSWIERGSNSDAIGPSNGNTRANSGITSGRIDALWVDNADATGKTVWAGGRGGGLWKTTDITVSTPNWTLINDYMINLSIASITQDPTAANILYFCTGASYGEIGALQGNGVFKSIDNGVTWSQLASTNNSTFYYCTRILCDFQGNIYVGTQSGLFRSTKASGGAAWTNITPSGVSAQVCDLEINSTTGSGRLHAVFGIFSTLGYRYTDIPATVAAGTWTTAISGFPAGSQRAEIDVVGTTLFCLPSTDFYEVASIYKSSDGGANWATIGGTPPTTASGDPFANGQGWYDLTVAINPANVNECIIGGIDNAKTTNGGTTWTRISNWVGNAGQYVHADQHGSIWYDNGNKFLFGCDGGVFYSADKGTTIRDRNTGLRLKQFYSVAIHPTTTNYFLTGSQDNGTHQFNNAGLSGSIEVFGGDGAYVNIDQNEPQFQTGAYVFSNYRRSSNSGANWSFGADNNNGLFINPYDYDNVGNKVYASYSGGNFLRWEDPQTAFSYTAVPVPAFGGQQAGAVTVSPYSANRVYFGMAAGGKIIRVDGANGAGFTATDITGAGMPAGAAYINCINTGTSDQFLVACYSNYGTSNIWVSTNGGTAWANIDGNLPNMPVYWAMYHPDNNTKMFIATETGVWETELINGASTIWTANNTFPTARATMLKYRTSDRTIAASTYGRGLWTSTIPGVTTPDIQFQVGNDVQTETTVSTDGCRGYKDYTYNMTIANAPTGAATVTIGVAGGATATANVDYIITTNGNFVTPGNTLNFGNGVTTPKAFTIRVFNDDALEAVESFTVNYTISGATNAQVGASNQTFIFSINSNDAAPIASFSGNFTVGTYNGNASSQTPFASNLQKYRIQGLFTKAELNSAGINFGANINSITLRVVTKNSTQPYAGFTIAMANTAATSLSSGFISPTFTTVYSGNYTTTAGSNLFNFTTPFAWDGTSNVLVNFCFDNITAGVSPDITEATGAPLGTGIIASTHSSSVVGTGCSLPAAFLSDARFTATFNASISGTAISTVLNNTKTTYLGPNDDVYFYDGTGNIMARLRNLTNFNYGCTQLIIDRAGSASTPFWNATTANNLASKTVKLITTDSTSNGSIQVTLYYTTAEVNGWQTATGQAIANSQLVKVANGFFIPNVTPATTLLPNVLVAPSTNVAFGTTGFSLTTTFTNTKISSSGIGMGIPCGPTPAFVMWTGGLNTTWANTANWSCGLLPGPTSEVWINGGLSRYPLVNTNVTVKSLTVKPGATVTVVSGNTLTTQ